VSSVIPGQPSPDAILGPSSSPIAQVSASAIARNAAVALAEVHHGAPLWADLRRDAWGHGAPAVAAELLAAGIGDLLTDAKRPQGKGPDDAQRCSSIELDLLTLYGLPGGHAGAVPVMRLSGTVLSVKAIRKGEGVSYGYSYRAPADSRVALVSGGYAQGVVRALGNRASVRIGGRAHPIIGRVAMDVCVVDIADASVSRGDEAVFFGDPFRGEPSIAEWSVSTGLTAAEIVSIVGLRAERVVIE
jgi:alanine racemase